MLYKQNRFWKIGGVCFSYRQTGRTWNVFDGRNLQRIKRTVIYQANYWVWINPVTHNKINYRRWIALLLRSLSFRWHNKQQKFACDCKQLCLIPLKETSTQLMSERYSDMLLGGCHNLKTLRNRKGLGLARWLIQCHICYMVGPIWSVKHDIYHLEYCKSFDCIKK